MVVVMCWLAARRPRASAILATARVMQMVQSSSSPTSSRSVLPGSPQKLHVTAPDAVDVDLTLVRVPDDWLIFPAPDGDLNAPRHPDSVTKQFTKRAKKILGFSIRLHDLRVSHGTWLLDQGVPVHVVAKRLGHDPSVLLKVYAKRTKKGNEAAAEKISLMTKQLSIGPS